MGKKELMMNCRISSQSTYLKLTVAEKEHYQSIFDEEAFRGERRTHNIRYNTNFFLSLADFSYIHTWQRPRVITVTGNGFSSLNFTCATIMDAGLGDIVQYKIG